MRLLNYHNKCLKNPVTRTGFGAGQAEDILTQKRSYFRAPIAGGVSNIAVGTGLSLIGQPWIGVPIAIAGGIQAGLYYTAGNRMQKHSNTLDAQTLTHPVYIEQTSTAVNELAGNRKIDPDLLRKLAGQNAGNYQNALNAAGKNGVEEQITDQMSTQLDLRDALEIHGPKGRSKRNPWNL